MLVACVSGVACCEVPVVDGRVRVGPKGAPVGLACAGWLSRGGSRGMGLVEAGCDAGLVFPG